VDDDFLFVKDSSIRLWELRIRGSHLLIHMISDSWTTQKEHVQKDVWNISIISMYGLVHYHQNTKQIFVEFPVTKDTKPLKQHHQFFLECIDLISEDVNVNRITATGAYMRHRFSWASFKLNNFSNFCPFAMFDSLKCS
jgi:hypothetical protein